MTAELTKPPEVTVVHDDGIEDIPDMICHAYQRPRPRVRATHALCGIRWQDDPHVLMHGAKGKGAFNEDFSCRECGSPLCLICHRIAVDNNLPRTT